MMRHWLLWGSLCACVYGAPANNKTCSSQAFLVGGDVPVKRIINGLWQTSGGWGPAVDNTAAVDAMLEMHARGFTTFDGADHYGPAEDLLGLLRERLLSQQQQQQQQQQLPSSHIELTAMTKWCPPPGPVTMAQAEAAVDKSLRRMKVNTLDVLQIHWWDYNLRKDMLGMMHHVDQLRKNGKVNKLSLTNFDTEHVALFLDEGIPISTNQVQFSLVDSRPLQRMVPFCLSHRDNSNVSLLAYGVLMGGLLTDAWLGKAEPSRADLATPSLGKYFNMLQSWGSWGLFQELLTVLRQIADRHSTQAHHHDSSSSSNSDDQSVDSAEEFSIANVAVKWVLDQPAVAGVIVGLRAGLSEHGASNTQTLFLELDDSDRAAIAAVTSKGRDLIEVIGDCGDEYRRRR